MTHVNPHFARLSGSYLFSQVAHKVRQYTQESGITPINLGIGDTVLPLGPSVIDAFQRAVAEMGERSTFRGYGPEQGYPFLRECIVEHDYRARGIDIHQDEIFISDGAKCDSANIQELFAPESTVAVPNPIYPVYLDSNIIAGRGSNIHYLEGSAANNFIPTPPAQRYDLIYLCFPNNPTGAVCSVESLTDWVNYALHHNAIIIFDAAYESFITDSSVPHSIYEIPEAQRVAIEMRSFSKSASFTGTRCAFTVVPKACTAYDARGERVALHSLWARRVATKFNGVSYPVQRAAAALYTPQGKREVAAAVEYYTHNASLIRRTLSQRALRHWGGVHSPYIWVDSGGASSWELFDRLLKEASVVTTPGVGFGSCGEHYIRISALNLREQIERALEQLQNSLQIT